MIIKKFADEWFLNCGLVGLINVLEFAQRENLINLSDYHYKIEKESLSFDDNLINKLAFLYFAYMIDKYDRNKDDIKHCNSYFESIINKKNIKENFDKIKKFVSNKNKKIEKFKVSQYDRCKEIEMNLKSIKKLDTEESINLIKSLINEYLKITSIKEINEKITINYFKSLLSKFKGQSSFLNVSKNKLTKQEQINFINKDFFLPVLQLNKLEQLKNEENEEVILKYLKSQLKNNVPVTSVTFMIKRIYKNMTKKKKDKQAIKKEIDKLYTCQFCNSNHSIGDNYSDSFFNGLGLSIDNSTNKYWNNVLSYPVCPVCNMLSLFIQEGCFTIYKAYLDGSDYDKNIYMFINLNDSLQNLYNFNISYKETLNNRLDNQLKFLNKNLIEENNKLNKDIVSMKNAEFIELKMESYDKRKSQIHSYVITGYLEDFFANYAEDLETIGREKARLLNAILNKEDLKVLIDFYFRDYINNRMSYISLSTIYKTIKIRYILNSLLGGNKNMNKKFIYRIKSRANDLRIKLKAQQRSDTFFSSTSYKMLNVIKANDKNQFLQIVSKLYVSTNSLIPNELLSVLTEDEVDFSTIAYAFLIGFNEYEYKNKKTENIIK